MDDSFPMPDWLDVSRETRARLVDYLGLIEKWNPAINLVSPTSLRDGWQRHVLDSAQLVPYIAGSGDHWVDIGSGAGLPGLVISVIAKDVRPDLRVTLVESDRRKATFLSEVARQLNLSADIVCRRIEAISPMRASTVSARALAPLQKLLGLVAPHLGVGGQCLFLKGRNHAAELEEARKVWSFDCDVAESRTEGNSAILVVRGIRHA